MFFLNKKTLLAASVAVFMPLAAQAATINFGDEGGAAGVDLVAGIVETGDRGILESGDGNQLVFRFNITEDLVIPEISLSATGLTTDLPLVTIDYFALSGQTFQTVVGSATAGFAGSIIPGSAIDNPFADGDFFTLTFNDGTAEDVRITATFTTQAISAVPVPASLLLLGTALGGLGMSRRFNAKKA